MTVTGGVAAVFRTGSTTKKELVFGVEEALAKARKEAQKQNRRQRLTSIVIRQALKMGIKLS